MKTSELRIGNLVYGIDDYKDTALPIYSINGDDTIRLKVGNESIGCYSVDWIKPITLTKEWLVKFGFDGLYKNDDFFFELIHNDIIGFRLSIDGQYGYKEIKYIHELQNLYFALTRKELKRKKI